MPRMKLSDRDFNVKELDVDYEPSDFKRYDGDMPRSGTILRARVTKLWWTQSGDGTSAMKVLAVAEQNTGDRKKYNGLPIWDFLTFKPEAAFRYMPFLHTFEIQLQDIRRHMMVGDEPENLGDPILSIGDWSVGSDDALCRIVVKVSERYGAEPDRDGWLTFVDADADAADDDDEDDDEDDEPPARPTRSAARRGNGSRSTSRTAGTRASRRQEPEPDDDEDEYDEDEDEYDPDDPEDTDDEDEDDEPDEPPARPTRQARSRTTQAPARGAREGSGRGRPAARSSARSAGSSDGARASRAAARDRRGRGSNEDPPF